ncbi:MAG: mammalian cell entry protein, partial [Frankiales bacterium]|nr:mammalian cell entry protein [Frankiales bacterium]
RRLDQLLTTNSNRLIRLAADSLPSLRAYQRYSPGFACLAKGLDVQNRLAEVAFGGAQPGLHITLEVAGDQNGYLPGDEPVYGEDAGPTCRGLPPNPAERPFPVDQEVTDGYCDDQEQAPGVQTGCAGREPLDPALLLGHSATERTVLGAIAAPVLGVPPSDVPDLALLLFGPLARGTEVGLALP